MHDTLPPESTASAPPTFDVIPLSADIRQGIDALGYTSPTPVQIAVFEPAVRGKSLVVQARTGTGKTAAFGLPILDQLVRRSTPKAQALILTPTRELAIQVANELDRIGRFRGLSIIPIYGGAPMGKQVDALAAGAQVVVGTPGRVLDHLRRGTFDATHVRIFVLDEADEMLSMGFAKELHAIVEHLPKERQGLFFSATIPSDIERLARAQLRDPEFVTLSSDQVGALEINHFVYVMKGGDKRQELVRILEIEDPESAVVFCNTKDETQRVAEAIQNKGYDADWLNGDLEQRDRERIMQRTREGKLRFLVATDVAARGIDISHLTHVINADFPENAEGYVHRTGRTGRAGRTGTAISLVGPKDIGNLYILRLTYKIRPVEKQLPTAGELKTRQESDLLGMFTDAFAGRAVHPDDLALARRLLTHVDGEKIVAGLLRDHLGARPGDPAAEAAEARRAKNPPPAIMAPVIVVAPAPLPIPTRPTPATASPARMAPAPTQRAVPDAPPLPAFQVSGDAPLADSPTGPARRESRVREERAADGRRSHEAARPGESRSRGKERMPSRAKAPHASYVTWEPPSEVDDDKPILREAPPMAATTLNAPPLFDEEDADFAQIFINVGRRDGARAGDFQRLLEQGAGLSKEDTGRIRVRERNTFVSVRKEWVDKAVAAIAGQVIGGRTVLAEPAKRVSREGAGSQGAT